MVTDMTGTSDLIPKDIPLAPYDWKKTAMAGLRRAGLAFLGIVAAALVQALQDPQVVGRILGEGKLSVALVPAVVGVASAIANWKKNKDR